MLENKRITSGCSFHPAFSLFSLLFPQTHIFCLYDLQMRNEMIFKVVEGERENKTWSSALCLTLSYQRKNEAIDFLSVSFSAGNIKTDFEVSHESPSPSLLPSSPPLFRHYPSPQTLQVISLSSPMFNQLNFLPTTHFLTLPMFIPTLHRSSIIWCPLVLLNQPTIFTFFIERSFHKVTSSSVQGKGLALIQGWRLKRDRDESLREGGGRGKERAADLFMASGSGLSSMVHRFSFHSQHLASHPFWSEERGRGGKVWGMGEGLCVYVCVCIFMCYPFEKQL